MFSELFPICIWKTSVTDHDKIKEEVEKFVEEEYPKQSNTFSDSVVETHNVFTTYGQSVNLSWNEIFPCYMESIQTMGSQYGCYGEDLHKQIEVNSAWLNAYKTGQSHDIHDHLPNQFSAIHYIKYNSEVHTSTIFFNPYRQVANASAPHLRSPDPRLSPPMWAQRSSFPVKEGDLVVFPSFIEHMVLKQKSDDFRITLSFNFNFV